MNNQPENQPIENTPEAVNHPSHYQGNGLEVIDVIEAFDLDFHLGNSTKYILRAGKKTDDEREDLKKARWYLDRKIENLPEQLYPEPTPQPDQKPTEHETLIETLYAWSLQHKIFPVPLPGIYHFRRPNSKPLLGIEISVRGTAWGYSLYQNGKIQQSGGVGTPADLIELLNRLLPTK